MSDWKVLINQKLIQFVYFVNHLNRRQLAFLSTLFSMGFLLLILGNLHLYPNYFNAEKDIEILMALESPLQKKTIKHFRKKEAPENSEKFKCNTEYNSAKKATYNPKETKTPSGINAASGSEEVGVGNSFSEKLKALEERKSKSPRQFKSPKERQH